jgi:hypothetical protein
MRRCVYIPQKTPIDKWINCHQYNLPPLVIYWKRMPVQLTSLGYILEKNASTTYLPWSYIGKECTKTVAQRAITFEKYFSSLSCLSVNRKAFYAMPNVLFSTETYTSQ